MNRTLEQIKNDMLNHITNTMDKSENSFVHDPLSAAAIEFFTAYRNLEETGGKLDIENLEGGELERFVYQRTGINRKYATRAFTSVVISGQEGASIEKGDLVSSGTVDFASLENATIDSTGKMSVFVACEVLGSIGNVPANSITIFPVAISGLANVYNPYPVTNGYDEENDEELTNRYFDKLQRPGKSGNKYHYEEWAKSVIGVGNAKIVPRWAGPLTVKVVIIDANSQPASEELVQNVSDYIDGEKPIGADVTVVSATEVPINITVTLELAEGYEELEVKDRIRENIKQYLNEIAFQSTSVSYARIGNAIISTDGVIDYTALTVNAGTANIPIANEEIATMGAI